MTDLLSSRVCIHSILDELFRAGGARTIPLQAVYGMLIGLITTGGKSAWELAFPHGETACMVFRKTVMNIVVREVHQ